MLLVGNGQVVTRDEKNPFIKKGAVVIENDLITEVGEESKLKAKYPQAEYVDAFGNVIMPGLINAHTHIYSGLARGLSIKGNHPTNFLEILEGTWWKLDRNLTIDGTKASAYATIIDCIKNGVTTIFDHHASYGEIPGSLFAIKDVAGELGIRACLCYEVSDRDGGEKTQQSIRENADFIKWTRENDDDMIRAMFGGHAPFTLSDETLEKMAAANEYGVGFHIHVAEGLNDVYDSMKRYGTRSVHRLLQHGILGENTILGHCIHVTPAEMDIIKETETTVVNNPESNMSNAVGCAPVLRMMERGITVGMGTDAYTHDMLESLKAFLAVQRHNEGRPDVAFSEAVELLFYNNARIAKKIFGKEIGVLKEGAKADVVIMDYHPFTPLEKENIDGHIMFGMSGGSCRTAIINGRTVYRDRKFEGTDLERITDFVQRESRKLWGCLNPA